MAKDKVKKIHFLYGCITALLIAAVGIGLVISCVNIYNSGDRPFSREVIAMAFRQLAIPGWLCLLAVIGGIVLHVALPIDREKIKPIRCDKDLLSRYTPQFDTLPEDAKNAICDENKRIKGIKITATLLIAALAVYPMVYFVNAAHFGVADINGDILSAVLVALIPTAVAFTIVYLCGRLIQSAIQRQIDIYKNHSVKPEKVSRPQKDNNRTNIVRYVLIGAAVALIIMGIANEGVADVLGKAIRICTECIGLG